MDNLNSLNQTVATSGNKGFATAGKAVQPMKGLFSIEGGEPFIEDVETGLTISVADLSSKTRVRVGVGIGKKNRPASRITYLGGDAIDFSLDNIDVSYKAPTTTKGQIVDIPIGCIKYGASYDLELRVHDNYAKRLFGNNGDLRYHYSYATNVENDCEDCTTAESNYKVACGLAAKINEGRKKTRVSTIGEMDNELNYQPFFAAVLNYEHPVYTFELTKQNTACEDCTHMSGLKTITIDGSDYDLTIFASTETTPLTYPEHMKHLEMYLNEKLADTPSKVKVRSSEGKCDSWCIDVITCAVPPVLTLEDNTTVAPTTTDPWNDRTILQDCKPCGGTDLTITDTAIVRIYMDDFMPPCLCDLPGDELHMNTFFRKIWDVNFLGDEWVRNQYTWYEVQKASQPVGYGYYHMDRALTGQTRDGQGWYYGGIPYGTYGTAPKYHEVYDAQNNVHCNELYCGLAMYIRRTHQADRFNSISYYNAKQIQLLIPDTDGTTHDAFGALFAAKPSSISVLGETCNAQQAELGDLNLVVNLS
jgi:hypothetical protein